VGLEAGAHGDGVNAEACGHLKTDQPIARMKRKTKVRARPRRQNLLIILLVSLAVLILLLRMAVFVAGHARHRF
jgi:hypothetical protein